MLTNLLAKCRRHVGRTIVVVVGVELALAVLIWYFGGGKATFQTLSNYAFLCASVVIASVAAIGSTFASMSAHDSLTLTQDSLELTRASQRPFLTATNTGVRLERDRGEVWLIVTNTGSLPADKVSVDMALWTLESKDSSEHILGRTGKDDTILFPRTNNKFGLKVTEKTLELVRGEKTGVRLTMKYQHKLERKRCETILVWDIFKEPEADKYYFRLDPTKSSWS